MVRLASALIGTGEIGGGTGTRTTAIAECGEGEGEVGVVVDSVIGQQEIVVKALSSRFEQVREISGGAVLGDGSICLILDVPSLVATVKEEQGQLVGASQ